MLTYETTVNKKNWILKFKYRGLLRFCRQFECTPDDFNDKVINIPNLPKVPIEKQFTFEEKLYTVWFSITNHDFTFEDFLTEIDKDDDFVLNQVFSECVLTMFPKKLKEDIEKEEKAEKEEKSKEIKKPEKKK